MDTFDSNVTNCKKKNKKKRDWFLTLYYIKFIKFYKYWSRLNSKCHISNLVILATPPELKEGQMNQDAVNTDWVFVNYTYRRFGGLTHQKQRDKR